LRMSMTSITPKPFASATQSPSGRPVGLRL
jgi:hypothetical protein